jgi:DNA invertase Pin-like site-specific DNA recombinase
MFESKQTMVSNKESLMHFGYVRTSTDQQNMELQIEALKAAGVDDRNIYSDKMSGSKRERPQLNNLLEKLRGGDTLVIWKFDRLARSMYDLLAITDSLNEKGVQFKSITEDIDTNSPMGKFAFHLLGALGQFERELIKERINAGIANARAKGKHMGRPRTLTEEQIKVAREMRQSGTGVMAIARILGCSRHAIYRVTQ